jgi:ribulose-phosphate 3-epimerase
MKKEVLIAPSMLACDFSRLGEEVEMVNRSQADWFHLDIMDGNFVPNISFGFPIIKSIAKYATKPLDLHLMIEKPERYIQEFAKANAHLISVHAEASPHLHRTLHGIRDLGVKAGVVLNPHTPLAEIEHILEDLDLVLIMSVNPGYGGQSFIPGAVEKISRLRKMLDMKNPSCLIQVDGGVSSANAQLLIDAGADVLVAGSAIFKAKNPEDEISRLKSIKQGQSLA